MKTLACAALALTLLTGLAQGQRNETKDGTIDSAAMHKKHLEMQLHWTCDQSPDVSKKDYLKCLSVWRREMIKDIDAVLKEERAKLSNFPEGPGRLGPDGTHPRTRN